MATATSLNFSPECFLFIPPILPSLAFPNYTIFPNGGGISPILGSLFRNVHGTIFTTTNIAILVTSSHDYIHHRTYQDKVIEFWARQSHLHIAIPVHLVQLIGCFFDRPMSAYQFLSHTVNSFANQVNNDHGPATTAKIIYIAMGHHSHLVTPAQIRHMNGNALLFPQVIYVSTADNNFQNTMMSLVVCNADTFQLITILLLNVYVHIQGPP